MSKKDTGVYKYLDCSTGHITEEDNEFLTEYRTPGPADLIVRPNEYGYWIHSMDNDENDQEFEEVISVLSISLQAVLRKCRKEGCVWINLDCNGFIHNDLPKYNW